jgi:hypothetical protein
LSDIEKANVVVPNISKIIPESLDTGSLINSLKLLKEHADGLYASSCGEKPQLIYPYEGRKTNTKYFLCGGTANRFFVAKQHQVLRSPCLQDLAGQRGLSCLITMLFWMMRVLN